MTHFALVFLATLLADVCWTKYFQQVAAKAAHSSAAWSAAIIGLGAFTVTEYMHDHWMAVAAMLGAYVGTWLTVAQPMTWLWGSKDGGPESRVRMWGLECKALGSILVLRFEEGTREAFHTHAFNAVSWVLCGWLWEYVLPDKAHDWHEELQEVHHHSRSVLPIYTSRRQFHKVAGGTRGAWVITFRGPWWTGWREYSPTTGEQTKLAQGRKERE